MIIDKDNEQKKDPVIRMTWEKFRECGMLWWINMILHTFGWGIVIVTSEEGGKIIDVYPARVTFRGFSEDITSEGYEKVSLYLATQGTQLYKESKQ